MMAIQVAKPLAIFLLGTVVLASNVVQSAYTYQGFNSLLPEMKQYLGLVFLIANKSKQMHKKKENKLVKNMKILLKLILMKTHDYQFYDLNISY